MQAKALILSSFWLLKNYGQLTQRLNFEFHVFKQYCSCDFDTSGKYAIC